MAHYDEIEIEDMDWNEELDAFTYSCPCGDLFQITMVGAAPPTHSPPPHPPLLLQHRMRLEPRES